MKGLLIFILLFPIHLLAQDLEGAWVGILHNDSTELDLHYEIVISEQKGKLTGFSYTNFIVDGRSYTGVKSLIINKRFGKLYVEDDKLVHHNYDFEPPKGVRQASILEMSNVEEMLAGRFTTTKTKQYGKPVTGHIYLLKRADRSVSKLMEILHGLNLASNLSFIQREQAVAVVAPTEVVASKNEPTPTTQPIKETPKTTETKESAQPLTTTANNTPATTTNASSQVKEPVKRETVVGKSTESSPVNTPVVKETTKAPVATETTTVKPKETATTNVPTTKGNNAVTIKQEPATTPVVKEGTPAKPKETTTAAAPVVKETNTPKKTETTSSPAPVVKTTTTPTIQQQLATRKIEPVQTIWFTSDSLLLELYDNGYVDGDSVSVVVNGKAFISNLRLSEKAARKTIYITPDMGDSVNLVMFAENLGTIYPNSGLAIIRDGKKEHRVAFSGDLQKNASIILRRRRD